MDTFVKGLKNLRIKSVDLNPRIDIIVNSSASTIELKYRNIPSDLNMHFIQTIVHVNIKHVHDSSSCAY
ncbi:hypothetical protein V2J09_011392 [Rumex salicifolius]